MNKQKLIKTITQIFPFLVFSVFNLIGTASSYSQSFDFEFGARSKGIGNSNTILVDEWAIFNNVAGISGIEKGSVVFGYDRFFNIEGFDRAAVAIIHPVKIGSIGLSAFHFGDDLYNEKLISSAFSNKIGFVRLGLRANYYQMRIDEFGTTSAILLILEELWN